MHQTARSIRPALSTAFADRSSIPFSTALPIWSIRVFGKFAQLPEP
jgi:hypothetical protein